MRIPLSLIMIICLNAFNPALANEAKQRSIYTDIKAFKVGDLLTVLIVEDSRAVNKAKTTTKKKTDTKMNASGSLGPFEFVRLYDAAGGNEVKFDGQGQTEKYGALRAKLTATVIAAKENGDLVIEGSRVVTINNEEETYFLSGVVRPRDINNNNTIYSYQIADAKISSKGKGTVTEGQRPGIITRVLNWIF
ncbi:MAG: flagellar basal body L-ring protein FlgH [candidate division Zixibacteria bacterium]|nr:flagellar basal body L-ring protein FlgH [candidate division Zixibacteria bacterium]